MPSPTTSPSLTATPTATYTVECADRRTAEPYRLLVEAASPEDALAKASARHLASAAVPLVQPVALCEADRDLLRQQQVTATRMLALLEHRMDPFELRSDIRAAGSRAVAAGIWAAVVVPCGIGSIMWCVYLLFDVFVGPPLRNLWFLACELATLGVLLWAMNYGYFRPRRRL